MFRHFHEGKVMEKNTKWDCQQGKKKATVIQPEGIKAGKSEIVREKRETHKIREYLDSTKKNACVLM